ncbi:MAG: C40 family peptidase [Clostridia bacterium]|nr:C40 family peptidase [Clostridia bacterium]
MSERNDFITAARSQVNKGIYVWGARGQNVSAMSEKDRIAWITRREGSMENVSAATIANNIKRDLALYAKRVTSGVDPILAFDCSGLIYWCNVQAGIGNKRLNAQGIYATLCKPITADDMQSADLCFHYSEKDGKIVHVGIFAGDDTVIECKGRYDGVVITEFQKRVKSGYWNRFGRLKKLQPEPTPTTHQYVKVKGGSVRVREGNGTNTQCVGIAHKGDTFPCFGQADYAPYWYRITYRGQDAYITCNERYTEVIMKP